MKKYKVLNPISFGGRIERGTIINLSDFDAQRFDKNDVVLLAETEDIEIKVTEEETPKVEKTETPDDTTIVTAEVTPVVPPESTIETKTDEETQKVEA